MKHALEKAENEIEPCSEVSSLIQFIKESKRGIAVSCLRKADK
jgi:acyl-[acyl carrier protein]--UDP-N-acetylglucosamine O-acyltransferase